MAEDKNKRKHVNMQLVGKYTHKNLPSCQCEQDKTGVLREQLVSVGKGWGHCC